MEIQYGDTKGSIIITNTLEDEIILRMAHGVAEEGAQIKFTKHNNELIATPLLSDERAVNERLSPSEVGTVLAYLIKKEKLGACRYLQSVSNLNLRESKAMVDHWQEILDS